MSLIEIKDKENTTHWINPNNILFATALCCDRVEIDFVGDIWVYVSNEEWERIFEIIKNRERRK